MPSLIDRFVPDAPLRAVAAGCRFASTGRVTLHKFAAAHRFLSYRFPSAREQAEMLEALAGPNAERAILARILQQVAQGGTLRKAGYWDASKGAAPGHRFRVGRAIKGLALGPPVLVERTMRLEVDGVNGAFDWHDVQRDVRHGAFRWSGRNPNPVWLVNARVTRRFSLRIPIVAVAHRSIIDSLRLMVEDRPADAAVSELPHGGFLLDVPVDVPLPVEGLKLTFQTWRPGSAMPPGAVRDRRFALGAIEVVLDNPFARAARPLTRPGRTVRSAR